MALLHKSKLRPILFASRRHVYHCLQLHNSTPQNGFLQYPESLCAAPALRYDLAEEVLHNCEEVDIAPPKRITLTCFTVRISFFDMVNNAIPSANVQCLQMLT